MNHSKTQIDDAILDDLACGNLSGEQYQQVLKALEAQPERWRDCALAFLQEQAWAQDLSGLAQTGFESPVAGAARPKYSDAPVVERKPEPTQPGLRVNTNLQWMHRMTSLAAMLLISFTVGWFGSGLRSSPSPNPGISSTSPSRPVTNPNERLVDRNPGNPRVEPQPVLRRAPDVRQDMQEFQFAGKPFVTVDRQLPDALRDMERRGLVRIESIDVLMPMDLQDGTSAIVPMQRYVVRPATYSY